jgi:hypothetical protein
MYVLNSSGVSKTGWPVQLTSKDRFSASQAVGDIDSDGEFEIVNGPWSTVNKVYAWNSNGSSVSGWPKSFNGDTTGDYPGLYGMFASPVLEDLDGDDTLEVIVFTMQGDVYAWHGDGNGFLNSNGFFDSTAGLQRE